jgi:signal transduction histidine kinase
VSGSGRRGLGIRGLIDRIDALDGSLDVSSEPGSGTQIQARIPVASVDAPPPAS